MAGGTSGYTQEVVALNVYPGARLEQRIRTAPGATVGVARTTMTITAEPVLFNFEIESLTKATAAAMLAVLRQSVQNISATVTQATTRKREQAVLALARGDAAATRRYTGGRIGRRDPGAASKSGWFNDSGRFAEGLFVMVNKVEKAFTINVPENRLNPSIVGGGIATVQGWYDRLLKEAPAFKGGQDLIEHREVRAAIEDDIANSIHVETTAGRARYSKSGGLWKLVARDALRATGLL